MTIQLEYPPVQIDIVEEHFEELDFLCEQRESVVFAPDWNLEELADLEERAEAHLDGLRLAAGHAVDFAQPQLLGSETFAAMAATLVLMESGIPAEQRDVMVALESAEAVEVMNGIRLALRHVSIAPIVDSLASLAASSDELRAAASADVLAFHRIAPPEPERLLQASGAEIRSVVHGALGRLGRLSRPDDLQAALRDESSDVQRTAIRAAAMSGMPGLANLLRDAVMNLEAPNLEAVGVLGIFGDVSDLSLLEAVAHDEEVGGVAIGALGACGRAASVPMLIDLMRLENDLSRAAAFAFQRITGMDDIDRANEPQGEGDEADDDLEADFREERPLPDAAKAEAWWAANAERFAPEGRWQQGIEVSDALKMMDRVSLQSRRDLYLYARASAPGETPDIELEAHVRR